MSDLIDSERLESEIMMEEYYKKKDKKINTTLLVFIPIILVATWQISVTADALLNPIEIKCMDVAINVVYFKYLTYEQKQKQFDQIQPWFSNVCEPRMPFNTNAFFIRTLELGYNPFVVNDTPILIVHDISFTPPCSPNCNWVFPLDLNYTKVRNIG